MLFWRGRILLMILAFIATFGSGLQAQETGTIQATATVLTALTVRGINNLEFGLVTPGVNKSVDKTDVGPAGEWDITGQPLAEIVLDIDLPDSLMHADSTIGMPLLFSTTDASYDNGTGGGQIIPLGVFNPHGVELQNLGAGGILWVWIGGTVLPRLTQRGGDYTADIVLTVTLTGN